MENEKVDGRVKMYAPVDVEALDLEIMRHITHEAGKLVSDGLSDLREYGTGEEYEVEVLVCFIRKDGK